MSDLVARPGFVGYPARRRMADPVALALLCFAGLNLNGVLLLVTRSQAYFSPIVLGLVVLLWLRHARLSALGGVYLLFAAAIGSYLVGGALPSLAQSKLDPKYVNTYFSTFIFVSGVYFWLVSCENDELDKALRFLKKLLLVGCVFTLLSRQLSVYFSYISPIERASGLFENPNEAAFAALFCLVLVYTHPPRHAISRAVQVLLPVAATLMTFSKTGFFVLLLLAVLFILKKRSVFLLVLLPVGLGLTLWSLWSVLEYDLFGLSGEQRERLADVLDLLGGDFNPQATTGRSLLWGFGFDRIGEVFPWGAGLGQFHTMEGGYRNSLNEWLGIHNTYLMILGEAGLIPFALFLLFIAAMLVRGLRSQTHRTLLVGFAVVFLADMFTSHDVLAFRLVDTILGVMIAISARAPAWEHGGTARRYP